MPVLSGASAPTSPRMLGFRRYQSMCRARLACARRLYRGWDERSILAVHSLNPEALGLELAASGYRSTPCHRRLVPFPSSVQSVPSLSLAAYASLGAASLHPSHPRIYPSLRRKTHLPTWSTLSLPGGNALSRVAE